MANRTRKAPEGTALHQVRLRDEIWDEIGEWARLNGKLKTRVFDTAAELRLSISDNTLDKVKRVCIKYDMDERRALDKAVNFWVKEVERSKQNGNK